ncbi:MAG: SSS family transporter: sodium ion/pantothenate [Monoraphidium minutum]|nr:MAG: SSS family transporter: sodium ion/pantothenate [Monoraphidium minutum]
MSRARGSCRSRGSSPWPPSLYSGYSVSGSVNESFNAGWTSTRWIPGGIGVYVGFLFLAPRFHALGKSRGYMTVSHFIYDRYLPCSSTAPWVAHLLRVLSFAALQLPIFTYLITQFQALGIEVRTFTGGAVSPIIAVCVAAGVLLISDVLGGMRSVAYTDVVQGVVLFLGSIIFLVIQRTELGGLAAAAQFYRNPANAAIPAVAAMQTVPSPTAIVSYFDFVIKTTIAATMFPHLSQRLFAGRSPAVVKRGLAVMGFTFFAVQLSSMITGWVGIAALAGTVAKGESAFSKMLMLVAGKGTGQAFLAALLLAAAICAMMSTADSALLAFSVMWTVDLYKPYVRPNASSRELLFFGRVMSVIGLAIGVTLGLLTIQTGTPNLSALFSLQNVTPIHVAPAVWLGLHWRGLRGEAVAAGMVAGLGVTVGLVFSQYNTGLVRGLDATACGLSTAMIGFFVNITITVALGLLLQARPGLFGDAAAAAKAAYERLDIGPKRDRMLNAPLLGFLFLLLLFTAPFCFKSGAPNVFVGDMAAWAFVALLLSGVLAIVTAAAYLFLWEDYQEPGSSLPMGASDAKDVADFGEQRAGIAAD